MTAQNMINIGGIENPVYVPEKSLQPETDEGREWWDGVASGSIVLDEETLNLLLKKSDEEQK